MKTYLSEGIRNGRQIDDRMFCSMSPANHRRRNLVLLLYIGMFLEREEKELIVNECGIYEDR